MGDLGSQILCGRLAGLGIFFLYFFWGRGDSIYMAWMMMDDDDDDDENENDDIP